MQIAPTITFKKAAKGARRITANFTSNTDLPDVILIDGTEDFRRVNKIQKSWMSRCRYSTLQTTLQYLDFTPQGIVIQPVSYDVNGNRIVTVTQDAVIVGPSAEVDGNTLEVTIKWKSTTETRMLEYRISKEIQGIGDMGVILTSAPKGSGSDYSSIDNYGDRGTINYYIYAAFPDTPAGQNGKLCGMIEGVEV